MEYESIYFAISSIIALFFLVIGYFWLYQKQRADIVREKLFAVRNDLFDEARNGNISFDDEAYKLLRGIIQKAIYNADKIDLWHILAFNIFVQKKIEATQELNFTMRLQNAMEQLSLEERSIVSKYLFEMNKTLVFHVITTNIVLVFFVLLPWALFKIGIKLTIKKVQSGASNAQQAAGEVAQYTSRIFNTNAVKRQTQTIDNSIHLVEDSILEKLSPASN